LNTNAIGQRAYDENPELGDYRLLTLDRLLGREPAPPPSDVGDIEARLSRGECLPRFEVSQGSRERAERIRAALKERAREGVGLWAEMKNRPQRGGRSG